MKQPAPHSSDEVGAWMMERLRGGRFPWISGAGRAIGQWDWEREAWVAGVGYYNYNGASIWMSVAAEPGCSWMTKAYLWMCFDYPFNQVMVKKIFTEVSEGNKASRRFTEAIGFRLEATLKDGDPDGDTLVYSMTREQCRWLNIRGSFNGQRRRSGRP